MLNIRLFYTTAIILFFLPACQREDLSVTNGTRLKKVKITNSDNSTYTQDYTYNNEGKMVRIDYRSSHYTWRRVADIEYDAGQRLVKATYSTVSDSNIVRERLIAYAYVYDGAGRIIKKIATPLKPAHEADDHTYTYDAQGRLVADTTLYRQTAKAERISVYTWDNNYNVIKYEDQLYNSNSQLVIVSFTLYTYDTKNNPYNDLGLPVYFLDDFVIPYMSRNNFTEFKAGGSLSDIYSREYNSNGLLYKTTLGTGTMASTFEYYYE